MWFCPDCEAPNEQRFKVCFRCDAEMPEWANNERKRIERGKELTRGKCELCGIVLFGCPPAPLDRICGFENCPNKKALKSAAWLDTVESETVR